MIEHVRRNFRYTYPEMTPAQYAAASVILDTDFRRSDPATVEDLTGTYPGAITGTPFPVENGMDFSYSGYLDFGAVAEFVAAAQMTVCGWVRFDDAGTWFSHSSMLSLNVSGAPPADVSIVVGVTGSAISTDSPIKVGAMHHIALVFNGAGATDADRLKLYIDGVANALTYTTPIPATLGSPPASTLLFPQDLASQRAPCIARSLRIFDSALTEAQVLAERASYACHPRYYDPLQDVDVTPGPIAATTRIFPSDWYVAAGTFSVTQDANLERWINCLTGGRLHRRNDSGDLIGTWSWKFIPGAATFIGLASSTVVHNGAGQSGYFLEFANGTLYLGRTIAGAYARLYQLGAYTVAAEHELMWSVRPSGQHDFYIRGGAYTVWTHIGPVTDTTYSTCAYEVVELSWGEVIK